MMGFFKVSLVYLCFALTFSKTANAFSFVPSSFDTKTLKANSPKLTSPTGQIKNGRNLKSPTMMSSSIKGVLGSLFGREGKGKGESSVRVSPKPQVQLPDFQDLQQAMEQGPEALQSLLASQLPEHPKLKMGVLPNGLHYIILPNSAPPGRFECHLEVFAGSSDELEHQQGMAHLVEHISYMGSRKRERLFGTGSQTNAYTDFHHTVFYASCPCLTPPGWGRRVSMLPRALDALVDVMEARCEESRLEKERAAVLSEMTMVNTIDYRVECQILGALHQENMLAQRFPIGKEHLIRSWTSDDIKEFHGSHYRPDNVMLYCIGDLDTADCEEQIRKLFSHLSAPPRPPVPITLKEQSRHFPPITHRWTDANSTPVAPKMFHHELLQSFSFHLFAKRPIEPIRTLGDFRNTIMKRVALAALQIRLNVNSRSDQLFTMIEFNQLDSPREACAVCYLDFTADPQNWREAVVVATKEIRRLGLYGLTQQELNRYATALLTDTQQLAAQGDRISNGDQLQFLMESTACGHTFMDPHQTYLATQLVVNSLNLDEVNQVAAEVCEHITMYGVPGAPQPSAVVACVPTSAAMEGGVKLFQLSDEEIITALNDGVTAYIEAEEDVAVPQSLITPEEIQTLQAQQKPAWVPVTVEGETSERHVDQSTQVVMRKLSNGMKVNMRYSGQESQRGHMRLVVPGGRSLEKIFGTGAVAIGAKTMQEGGAFGSLSREQVELFCIDHLLMVHIDTNEEYLMLDFLFPTTKRHANGAGREGMEDLSGTEASLQVVHQILTGFVWEEDALARAKAGFMQSHDMLTKSLEGKTTEGLMDKVSNSDPTFLSIEHPITQSLSLEQVQTAIMSQLTTDVLDISICGDIDMNELEGLVLKYLGTVPKTTRSEKLVVDSFVPKTEAADQHLNIFLPDSDERAVAYVAGSAPNRWGVLQDGRTLLDVLKATNPSPEVLKRWEHPLFANLALGLLREVVNRRLFSNVREQKRLTYDANFHLTSFDRLKGSWYLVTVTANPINAQKALQACKDTLFDLVGSSPITPDNVESAKRVLINRHDTDLRSNQYWVEMISGVQGGCVDSKDISCVRDFSKVVNSVTAKDLQLILNHLGVKEESMYTAIGVSGQKPPVFNQ
mmetsp:Transcript_27617/g.35886  ORF Transcript_27617/g.35886 Transcript_27617/m.35886 type:complete len:1126 (-) Transcript_27617:270-3647(-)